jgi:hypothetical protein
MRLSLVVFALFLTGCGASMVSTRGDSKSAYAPTNESAQRGGTIKYLNQGASSVKKDRREDAYKQMHDFCRGAYKITSEGPRSEGGDVIPVGGVSFYEDSQYWYMNFECEGGK